MEFCSRAAGMGLSDVWERVRALTSAHVLLALGSLFIVSTTLSSIFTKKTQIAMDVYPFTYVTITTQHTTPHPSITPLPC